MTKVHSVRLLLNEFERLVVINRAAMDELDAGNWNVPGELRGWIDTIEAHDSGSTFSRYPNSHSSTDSVKSSFSQIGPEELTHHINNHEEGKPGKIFLLLKDDNEMITSAFCRQEKPLADFREALVGACKMLSGAAYGIHSELVDGIGKWLKQQHGQNRS